MLFCSRHSESVPVNETINKETSLLVEYDDFWIVVYIQILNSIFCSAYRTIPITFSGFRKTTKKSFSFALFGRFLASAVFDFCMQPSQIESLAVSKSEKKTYKLRSWLGIECVQGWGNTTVIWFKWNKDLKHLLATQRYIRTSKFCECVSES